MVREPLGRTVDTDPEVYGGTSARLDHGEFHPETGIAAGQGEDGDRRNEEPTHRRR